MKKILLSILGVIPALFVSAQVLPPPPQQSYYPYDESFESYTNTFGGSMASQTPLWIQTPLNLFSVYNTHGVNGSKGLTKQLTQPSGIGYKDSIISPLIGPLTATSEFSFDYRIVNTNLYPSSTPTLSSDFSMVLVATASSLPISIPILTINSTNHVASTSFVHKTVAFPALAAGQNMTVKIVVTRGAAGDFFVDIDNFRVADAGSTTGISNIDNSNSNIIYNTDLLNKTISINSTSQVTNLIINSVDGKEVYSSSQYVSGNSIALNVSGVYIIQCTVNGRIERRKVIIN